MRLAVVISFAVAGVLPLAACQTAVEPAPAIKTTRSPAYEKAMITLQVHARDSQPATRANCIEALQVSDDPRARGIIEQGLSDTSSLVRYSACMAAGKRKDVFLLPRISALANNDPDGSVRVAAAYAAYRMGNTDHLKIFIDAVKDPSERVRANAYNALGLMGNKDYVPLLADRKRTENDRLQPRAKFELTAALARLGDHEAVKVVASLVYAKVPEDQWNALLVCPDLPQGDVINAVLWCLKHEIQLKEPNLQNLEVRRCLIAARALGKMNKMEGPNYAVTKLDDPAPDVRALAALALGEILNPAGEKRLEPLLDDKNLAVQIAASAAIVNVWSRTAQSTASER